MTAVTSRVLTSTVYEWIVPTPYDRGAVIGEVRDEVRDEVRYGRRQIPRPHLGGL